MSNCLSNKPTLLCLSHLRWVFVFQRPQHLMKRLGQSFDVLFWEEMLVDDRATEARVDRHSPVPGVTVLTPFLPAGLDPDQQEQQLAQLISAEVPVDKRPLVRWYYTPMMLPFTRHIEADCTIYDCMDELANFDQAPPELVPLETELLSCADLVFTGGYSLYEAKANAHPRVYPFPSSVETEHFRQARLPGRDPADQATLPHPRLGYFGVIDERFDAQLLDSIAAARPDWSFVIIGPVVKIDPGKLPRRPNIQYLGAKDYSELPDYLRGWDVALMPFAINAATKFISPTKTPEYLASGRPVVSTAITDVVRQYGELEAVEIASTARGFLSACERLLALPRSSDAPWRLETELLLSQMSWDNVVRDMSKLIHEVIEEHGTSDRYYDYLIVGAGFAGAVMAERLAAGSNKRVLVVDRRSHIGGNAHDKLDEAGILIHQYGPHIFHTNSADIFAYLSRFTEWRPYEHRVRASVDDKLVPVPINRTTLNLFFGIDLKTDAEAAAYLEKLAEPVAEVRTSKDVVVGTVGRQLYETFFQGYTRKQWGLDPSELDKSVTARIPTRSNDDDRYFTDTFQAMPADGYTAMFERILDHPRITVLLDTDYKDIRDKVSFEHLVFTGPIDEYFDFCYGKLPYRSLEFRHETHDVAQYQGYATVNYPSESVPFTRITEYKHLTGQVSDKTSITYEFPQAEGDPYYPVPRPENAELFKRYEALALGTPDVTFVGRLATYRYYNMDQVVGQALATYRRHVAQVEATHVAPEPVA